MAQAEANVILAKAGIYILEKMDTAFASMTSLNVEVYINTIPLDTMITGLNHLTLAVQDMQRSFDFYVDLLKCRPEARWDRGAYLSAGSFWLCLSLDKVKPSDDYTHVAFSVAPNNFADAVARLTTADVSVWKTNASEGQSFYFLDPDGHKLEIHDGDLSSRLAAVSREPYDGWVRFDQKEIR